MYVAYLAPLIVLSTLFFVLTLAGRIGIPATFGWWTALRIALAGMFLLTASAHWGQRRADLIRMVPTSLPRPDRLVTFTGVLEILGAIGLLIPATAPAAGLGLSGLLLAVFPANVRAARQKRTIAGRPTLPLVARGCVQVVFLAATVAVFLTGFFGCSGC